MVAQDKSLSNRKLEIEDMMNEWLLRKATSKSGSQRTIEAYKDTLQSFRTLLRGRGMDLLDESIELARVAQVWAALRSPNAKRRGNVADSTYNQRLAILSSFYTFLNKAYQLGKDNPIASTEKRHVQAYAYAEPIKETTVLQRLAAIDTTMTMGRRNYVLLCLGLLTGRRASELTKLTWNDVRIDEDEDGYAICTVTFHCKGNKVYRNALDAILSTMLLEYLIEAYGDLDGINSSSPIWLSFSPFYKNRGAQPIGIDTLYDICQEHMGTSKIHTLRHTFAKQMEKSGATLTEIQQALGHENVATTAKYLKELRNEENKYLGSMAGKFGIGQSGNKMKLNRGKK